MPRRRSHQRRSSAQKRVGKVDSASWPVNMAVAHTLSDWYECTEVGKGVAVRHSSVAVGSTLTDWYRGSNAPSERQSARKEDSFLGERHRISEETAISRHEEGEVRTAGLPSSSPAGVAAPTPAQELQVGTMVRVQEDFRSNSWRAGLLDKGQVGVVEEVDEIGDVGIKFAAHSKPEWVCVVNRSKLEVMDEAPSADELAPQEEQPESGSAWGSVMDNIIDSIVMAAMS